MKIRGKIRFKIIMVVLPILILTSAFIGISAYLSSTNGITNIAKEFLGYKLSEIYKYAAQQNSLLEGMGLSKDPYAFENVMDTVANYSTTVLDPADGGFVIIDSEGNLKSTTISNFLSEEAGILVDNIRQSESGWIECNIGGKDRVGVATTFLDWDVNFALLVERSRFYKDVNDIVNLLIIILSASIVISSIILLFFIRRITNPINEFVETIQGITSKMDLTQRVKIHYPDEVGYLGFYFNNMIAELEGAYNQIKNYAYQTVLAKKKEERIRIIFQKFVPQEVINQILNLSQDSMLIGTRQTVTVFFSDIRSFTSISETMKPEELVLSLNAYFDKMVRVIMERNGTVDKFIGDAIMAIFGAPLVRADDAENAIQAALENHLALSEFNEAQRKSGKVEFKIGVGLNTGDAIVGNIGSEQKIDYTVIGDTVNLASRLEGLTKKYYHPIVISEFTRNRVTNGKFFYRELDNVRVKGKKEPVKIFCPMFVENAKHDLDYYDSYHKALNLYYQGHFYEAKMDFSRLLKEKPDDKIINLYIERCDYLIANPPEQWDGVETWTTK